MKDLFTEYEIPHQLRSQKYETKNSLSNLLFDSEA